MKTPQAESDKHLKVYARIFIFLLGGLIFAGLILQPVSDSFAQGIDKLGINPISFNENNADLLKQTYLLTDTITSTPTVTITETPTAKVTSTSTITATPTSTSTSTTTTTPTNTPTGTATETATATSTSTASATSTGTSTSTATPTLTGTQPTATITPTPTKTGTLTPVASLSVSVTPTQAKVNESFTFTIKVGNTGSLPTSDNIVVDSLPTFIDVTTVTTSKGTITKLTHSFIVSVGDVNPGDIVTIIAIVRVNSTLSRTESLTNVVTMTYDQTKSITASVGYKVLFQTLPPTGELPLNWRQERIKPVAMIPGLLLMSLGGILLIMVVWSKTRNHKDKLWMTVSGTLLILVGFVAGVSASGLFTTIGKVQYYQMTPTSGGLIAQMQPVDPSATTLPRLPASAFSTPDSVIPIVTLPDYPIPTPVITITPQPGEPGPDTSAVLRIVIPALFLDTDVKYVPYDGFSWLISGLRQEIAWMGNTSWPGLGGNTALAGHVTVAGMGDGPFRHLDELPNGELVLLYTEKNIYTYQVRESRVTDDGDMSVTLATDNPQISLITCIDWDEETHSYLNRLVVIADLVRSEPITMGKTP
jgi:LPXTG-site transpeptidase (sortase) family protein